MREVYLVCTSLVFCFCSVSSFAALDRIGDFALLDDGGEFHQLSRYQHKSALVIMSYAQDCGSMNASLEFYRNQQSKYAELGVEFLLIDSQDLGRSAVAASATGFPILEDDGQLVSETLDIAHAGAVRVLNPQRLSVFYQGPANEQLDQALTAILDESLSDTVSLAVDGCAIDYPNRDSHASTPPDYANDVAPIIIENCSECHRQGGVGPFAIDSYIMMLGWSPMIREVLLNKRMPPAQVDPYVGHSDDARYLSSGDLQTLIHWIDAGAPRGSADSDPLETLQLTGASQWILGEPDFIATGADNEVPATGVMDYIYDDIELGFSEDKWVRAVQYKPGDEAVLHHLMTFVTAPDEDFWGAERRQESVTRRFVEGYAPGQPKAVEFTAGTALRIPAGHKLSMQFHYVTNGLATVDVTQLGLYFTDATPLQERLTQAVPARFLLSPNDPNHEMHAEQFFEHDIVVTGVRARMNNRGKKMKFAVEFADGSMQEIFSVPAYNYGWQPHYYLDQPVVVPAGSTLHVIGAFDNSISNPTNPDPEKEVSFGLESWDEMFTGYFTYHQRVD